MLRSYLPRPLQQAIAGISDTARQRFVLDCAARMGRVSVAGPARVRLVEKHEVSRTFVDRGFHVYARVEPPLAGDLAFFLPLAPALSMAGSLLQARPEEIAAWRAAGEIAPRTMEAVAEISDLLVAAFARTLGQVAGAPVVVRADPSRLVSLAKSKADFDDVFRWRPFVGIESPLVPPESPPGALLELWTLDLARSLAARLGFGEPLAALAGVVICLADKAVVHDEVAALLDGHPLGLVSVSEVADAFDAAVRYGATAILLDAGRDGRDVCARCRRLREDPRTKDLPVVVLADHGRREEVIQAIQSGARDWLVRPFEPDTTLLRLAKHAARAEAPESPPTA